MKPAIEIIGLSKCYRLKPLSRPSRSVWSQILRALKHPSAGPLHRTTEGLQWQREGTRLWALRDISMNVERGSVFGIVGRNGTGKSTLLKVLSQITEPTAGRAILRGRHSSLLEVGTGFHPDLTGRENVFINGAILGMRLNDIKKRFDEIVHFSGIETFIDVPVKHYSSGMYLRLAFSIAAHLEAEILFVDEVLSVGDQTFQQKCLEKTERISEQGKTVVWVSHNLGAITRLCDRCAWLDQGTVMKIGNPRDVVMAYASSELIESGETVIPEDPSKPGAIRRIGLINSQGEFTNRVAYEEPARFRIEYEIKKPVRGWSVFFGLQTADHVKVLVSADIDTRSELLGWRHPGHYCSVVEIPARWLNIGHYKATVQLRNTEERTKSRFLDGFSFVVVDTGSPTSRLNRGRSAILQPLLHWETRQVDEPATSQALSQISSQIQTDSEDSCRSTLR